MIKRESYDTFYDFFLDSMHEFDRLLTREAIFLDFLDDLDSFTQDNLLTNSPPDSLLDEFIIELNENEITLGENLSREVDHNILLNINHHLYFTKLYYHGIFKLYVFYLEEQEKFKVARKILGDEVYNEKFSKLENLFFHYGLLPVYHMADEILEKAMEIGIKSLHEPYSLGEEVVTKNINVQDPNYPELLFEKNLVLQRKVKKKFADYLGEHATALIPYLIEVYGNAQPEPIARMVIAIEEMGLTKGLLNIFQTSLFKMLQSEINPNLKVRGFTKALMFNNPKNPKNTTYEANSAYRKDLHSALSNIKKDISKVINI